MVELTSSGVWAALVLPSQWDDDQDGMMGATTGETTGGRTGETTGGMAGEEEGCVFGIGCGLQSAAQAAKVHGEILNSSGWPSSSETQPSLWWSGVCRLPCLGLGLLLLPPKQGCLPKTDMKDF